jgi:hypothetical protein
MKTGNVAFVVTTSCRLGISKFLRDFIHDKLFSNHRPCRTLAWVLKITKVFVNLVEHIFV